MTWLDWHDTIAAIATAQADALRGIVRMSGPKVGAILTALDAHPAGSDLTQRALAQHDAAQRRSARRARCGSTRLQLPPPWGPVPAIVYHWPEGASYTRQEMAELHLPGALPLVAAVLQAVCRQGARLARPGEFTLRAFLAGRLDLTQAEAVLGTIQAESPTELKAALRQLAGGLADPLRAVRAQLADALARAFAAGAQVPVRHVHRLGPQPHANLMREPEGGNEQPVIGHDIVEVETMLHKQPPADVERLYHLEGRRVGGRIAGVVIAANPYHTTPMGFGDQPIQHLLVGRPQPAPPGIHRVAIEHQGGLRRQLFEKP